ncbi:hypothetical protein BMI86_10360 [Thioclava sp. DLFJ5-1]|uniref:hypothetical protein n=1 Tax=Thioclava sp. DLFJ5-1 TaxID=1915314 RepID=UPI0009980276|nr:hypothetical protein [Thioclava sp. DLFJ5-1]OOY20898.1 hypothetical protein BMI86_10360 [Thioclava sp. DLFJ5-1]
MIAPWLWLRANWRLIVLCLAALALVAFGYGIRDLACKAELSTIRANDLEAKRVALEGQLEATQRAQARVIALQSALDKAKEAERDLPNGTDCGLSAGRVRLLPQR